MCAYRVYFNIPASSCTIEHVLFLHYTALHVASMHHHHHMQVDQAVSRLTDTFSTIDRLISHNLRRVQRAFRAARVGPHHFAGSTGYGHGDLGRAALDEV